MLLFSFQAVEAFLEGMGASKGVNTFEQWYLNTSIKSQSLNDEDTSFTSMPVFWFVSTFTGFNFSVTENMVAKY